ncbi:MAG: preprotein translocase subunit SecE [Firmicutes bacterium]|nr:preprotein translocase subunit SecE [Bacillota bacterium]
MADVKKENWFKRMLGWFKRLWGRICKYFRELKSELKKVVWPTPQQVAKNTLIVVACVLVVGVFIWLFDLVAQVGVDALINAFH